eukprot:g4613.t1
MNGPRVLSECTEPEGSDLSSAHDIIALHEHDDPRERLKNVWAELEDSFDDYPDYVVLSIKHQLDNLAMYPATGSSFRTWTPSDNMENTLTAIEKLRKKYVCVLTSSKPKDDDDGDEGDPENHDRAQHKTSELVDDDNFTMSGHVLFNYSNLTAKQKSRLWLWRLAYPSVEMLMKATKANMAKGLEMTDRLATGDDTAAPRARFKAHPHKHSETDYTKLPPLHSISIDQ